MANVGVLAGILFLAIEIQQNNNLLERDITLSNQDVINGQFINSEYLPGILTKINEATGQSGFDVQYIEEFGLTQVEATRWIRFINQQWRQNEANWVALGGSEEICRALASSLRRGRDHQIYWDNRQEGYNPEFVECVENAR